MTPYICKKRGKKIKLFEIRDGRVRNKIDEFDVTIDEDTKAEIRTKYGVSL